MIRRPPLRGTAAFLSLLAISAGLAFAGDPGTDRGEASVTGSSTPPAIPSPLVPALARDIPGVATPPSGWPITIAAVGDVMLGRGVAPELGDDDPAGPFRFTREMLAAADLAVANLESPIGSGGVPAAKTYTFLAPPGAALALATAGVDIVSLANNHARDYGPDALAETLSLLAAAGVRSGGAGIDHVAAAAPAVASVRGISVAFLAFNDAGVEVGRAAWEAAPGHPGVAWWNDESSPVAIHAAVATSDLVVVFVHFGVEYAPSPSERQREIARASIDAGASLVLGSHPHVLQEVEVYGAGLIAYSLGNFVFDGFSGEANETGILNLAIDDDGIVSWSITPFRIGADGLPRPIP